MEEGVLAGKTEVVKKMAARKPGAMVLRAPGTNCDYETLHALNKVGFDAGAVHVNRLVDKTVSLSDYRLLVIPGGFAHGDYIASGKLFANKLLYRLNSDIPDFIAGDNLVLGICNGFQVLVKAGILPGFDAEYREQLATLAVNESGRFQDEWVTMVPVSRGKCAITQSLSGDIHCPINHGEGRFVPANRGVLRRLYERDMVVFKYKKNPNGSVDDIAGICDDSGKVLGFMPHPEKNFYSVNDPRSTHIDLPAEGDGAAIFRGAYEWLAKKC